MRINYVMRRCFIDHKNYKQNKCKYAIVLLVHADVCEHFRNCDNYHCANLRCETQIERNCKNYKIK